MCGIVWRPGRAQATAILTGIIKMPVAWTDAFVCVAVWRRSLSFFLIRLHDRLRRLVRRSHHDRSRPHKEALLHKRIVPVIISGGIGSRLWPLSRARTPKQLLPLVGERTMIQDTALRVSDEDRFDSPVIICGIDHFAGIAGQMREAGISPDAVVLEPFGRNTAPAAAVAALIVGRDDPDRVILLLPSDQFVGRQSAFLDAIDRARQAAAAGYLSVFGVSPNRPETGFGYIRQGDALPDLDGVYSVTDFAEKPDRRTAARYIADGRYLWNSGMSVFSAFGLIREMELSCPKILAAARMAIDRSVREAEAVHLDREAFEACPSDSLDYAVMERTERAAVVPADFGWNDVGTWSAIWDVSEKDTDGNVVGGDAVLVDTKDSIVLGNGERLVGAVGVRDLVIVGTRDAVLVADRERSDEVKRLVEVLSEQGRREVNDHVSNSTTWGSSTDLLVDQGLEIRLLDLIEGATMTDESAKMPLGRLIVLRGDARVEVDGIEKRLKDGEPLRIPDKARFVVRNAGAGPLRILAVRCNYRSADRETPTTSTGDSI